jgi:hypothetical protein
MKLQIQEMTFEGLVRTAAALPRYAVILDRRDTRLRLWQWRALFPGGVLVYNLHAIEGRAWDGIVIATKVTAAEIADRILPACAERDGWIIRLKEEE